MEDFDHKAERTTDRVPDTDRLGGLLTAAAPSTHGLSPGAVGDLSASLAREVVHADRGLQGRIRGLRRRHKMAAGAAAAALVFVPTGAWAAQHFLAQTGAFGNPERNPDFEDRSEFIDTCARDFTRYVTTLAPAALPAPPEHTWSEYAADVAKGYEAHSDCAGTTGSVIQESSLRLDLVTRATSDWGCVMVWANEDGDRSTERTARNAMSALNAEATRLAPQSGAAYPPDVFLSNSRRSDWVGCQR